MMIKQTLIALFFSLLILGCSSYEESRSFDQNAFLLGQWQTTNKNDPHWIMFDSLNNYYRWSFNEEIPEIPEAKYYIEDSIITFSHSDDERFLEMGLGEVIRHLKLIQNNKNTITISPLDSALTPPSYTYERAQFEAPRHADIYFYYLTDREADSLNISNHQNLKDEIFKNTSYLFEHSLINSHYTGSSLIMTPDSLVYKKTEIGGYGIIFYTNDSTYIRQGFPPLPELEKEIDSLFYFVNRTYKP